MDKGIVMKETINQNDKHYSSLESEENILCSVCIATYLRLTLLEKLIYSLKNQVLPNGVCMEIIVVDNDPLRSAAPIVHKFENTAKICFNYYNQPIKNISLTRNLAVKNASGQYILFIDDDEVASSEWLFQLLKTVKTYNVDGVLGYVEPEFHNEAPKWVKRRDYFFSPMTATGTPVKHTFVGNCIIKASLLKKMEGPFDPQYGITGGEDTFLFDTMLRQGAVFVNCREAITKEFIPQTRTRLSYIFHRALKGGNSFARRTIETAGEKRIIKRLSMIFKGSIIIAISLIFLIILFPFKIKRTKWMIKLSENIGRFLAAFNWHYKAYK